MAVFKFVLGVLFALNVCSAVTASVLVNPERLALQEDPDIHRNTSQLITSKGYPCEEYDVHTKDGYILGIQRIPAGKTHHEKPCWVENLANNSLGFMLADAGYDVWMGNSRGNTYARRHETLNPDQKEFWHFSWDEMAWYDLPATVDKILSITGTTQLSYVGHSQGCEIAIAQLSRDPVLSKKINIFIGLAPATYLGDLKSPIKYLAPYTKDLETLYNLLGGDDEFLYDRGIIHDIEMAACLTKGLPRLICENVFFLIGGYDSKYLNTSRLPVYVAQHPAGTSVQNLAHYGQSVNTKRYQMMDFGPTENMKRYNQTTPPQYYPSNVTIPVALFSGTADWLVTPSEMDILVPQIKHLVKHKVIQGWEHLDFIWALNAPQQCYKDVIQLLKQYKSL